MRKRTRIAITAVIGVLAVGAVASVVGPRLYRDFFSAPPAEVPTLMAKDDSVMASPRVPLTAESLSGTWSVVDGSEAGYRVDEVLNGVDVTVTGRGGGITGSLTMDGTELSAAQFTVDVASIRTDNANRDAYFRDNALHASEFPSAMFELSEPVALPGPPVAGDTVKQEVTGELTLAGVTRPVTFTVSARTDGSTIEIAAQIPITFADFGVHAPSLGFVKVEDSGFVELQLVLQRD